MTGPRPRALRAAAVVTAAALAVTACAPSAPPGDTGPAARATCPTGPLDASFGAPVPRDGSHDAARLDEAVRHYTNRVRCDRGIPPVAADATLARAAGVHSADMARLDFFNHVSPVSGRQTPDDRIRGAGGRPPGWRRTAENIIEGNFVAYRSGTRYRTIDAAACRFVDRQNRPLPRHTYASLAQEMVRRWMESPGHRRNILNPALRFHGAGMAPNRTRQLCGGLYAAQVFAG